jgi:dipeptidyl aminopeptidase/acylaminoacyl peptidase
VSPDSKYLLTEQWMAHPPVSDLAQPLLRLAGLRINPLSNGKHDPIHFTGLKLIHIQERGEEAIAVPRAAFLSFPQWSPDGKHLAFTNTTPNGVEIWVADVNTGRTHALRAAHAAPTLRTSPRQCRFQEA